MIEASHCEKKQEAVLPHKHDVGSYSITFFDRIGRKLQHGKIAECLTTADAWGRAWIKQHEGGSYIVTRCVRNSRQKQLFNSVEVKSGSV